MICEFRLNYEYVVCVCYSILIDNVLVIPI